MSTYRYNVVIDVDVNTSKASGAPQKVQGAFAAIEAQAQTAAASTTKSFNQIDEAVNRSSKGMDVWGRAFKGAFIGAVVGMTFSTIISGITGIADATIRAGEAAVVQAGNFQATTAAMTVFTGSITAARYELARIDDLARHTNGLRMEEAEVGTSRLMALGFAAKTAESLIVGLATQKTLSPGIDEQAVQRVILNLTQLSVGSPRIQKDIQEMVTAMPVLRVRIDETFGSIEKFKTADRKSVV